MKRILLVEDNADNRDMLARRLLRRGYEVAVAEDGGQGLELAEALHPDVILMDLSMPVMDGWEAIRRLRRHPELSQTPVVALTGHAMKDDRAKSLAAGADEYMAKPLDFAALLKMLQRLLDPAIGSQR
jgi:two-component system cell cycle response regulator DivK